MKHVAKIVWSLCLLAICLVELSWSSNTVSPSIQIVILVHPYNKALYLPYLLGALEQQVYPKDRIRVHLLTERIFYEESYFDALGAAFDSDPEARFEILDDRIRANDETIEMLKLWTRQQRSQYNQLELTISNVRLSEKLFNTESGGKGAYWTKERFKVLIDSKNQELYSAFTCFCDFVLFLDADVILTEAYTLSNLTSLFGGDGERVVVAPMLYSTSTYSNFWGGMDSKGYYLRTDNYLPILERKEVGTFSVPMVHTAFMIDARKRLSRHLTFDPVEVSQSETSSPLPYDDVIAFAKSAHFGEIELYIDNRHVYGYIPPPLSSDSGTLEAELKETLVELQLESLINGPPFPVSPSLESYIEPVYAEKSIGVGAVYVINLRRRPERRKRMKSSLGLLNIEAVFWDATDGKQLSEGYLEKQQIRGFEGYLDPYHKRPMTYGEIGCFLSHYRIWEDAFRRNLSQILILEDDVRFDGRFRSKWASALARFHQLQTLSPEPYDLLYLGRKLNGDPNSEESVTSDGFFVRPGYSYWTIGYLITNSGIRKLLSANPLGRLLPVDEYLPLMYGSHPNETLVGLYGDVERLNALSLRQLLISPTHYVGDDAYISDTEHSSKVPSLKNVPNEESTETGDEEIVHKESVLSSSQLKPPPPSSSAYLGRIEL